MYCLRTCPLISNCSPPYRLMDYSVFVSSKSSLIISRDILFDVSPSYILFPYFLTYVSAGLNESLLPYPYRFLGSYSQTDALPNFDSLQLVPFRLLEFISNYFLMNLWLVSYVSTGASGLPTCDSSQSSSFASG